MNPALASQPISDMPRVTAFDPVKIGIVSISDRASSGVYEDKGLPALKDWLTRALKNPIEFEARLIPDEQTLISQALIELTHLKCALVLTTGGTGPTLRDVTPEATLAVAHKQMPGFGEQMTKSITLRRQWLVDNALGSETIQGQFLPAPNLLQQLRQRDLRQASIALSKELGLTHVEPFEGQQITGKFSRTAELASGKYAVIQKAKEFVLVPWQREFENTRSRPISGVAGGQGITWDWSGRKRGLEIS